MRMNSTRCLVVWLVILGSACAWAEGTTPEGTTPGGTTPGGTTPVHITDQLSVGMSRADLLLVMGRNADEDAESDVENAEVEQVMQTLSWYVGPLDDKAVSVWVVDDVVAGFILRPWDGWYRCEPRLVDGPGRPVDGHTLLPFVDDRGVPPVVVPRPELPRPRSTPLVRQVYPVRQAYPVRYGHPAQRRFYRMVDNPYATPGQIGAAMLDAFDEIDREFEREMRELERDLRNW